MCNMQYKGNLLLFLSKISIKGVVANTILAKKKEQPSSLYVRTYMYCSIVCNFFFVRGFVYYICLIWCIGVYAKIWKIIVLPS